MSAAGKGFTKLPNELELGLIPVHTGSTHNPPRLSGNADFTVVFEVLRTLAENPSLSATIKQLRATPVK
jgi:hypothetical protein